MVAQITEADIRRWRSSRRYRNARQYFLNAHPLCAHCQEAGYTVAAEELDHIRPVHKRPDLFWDRANWQGLCKPCHELKSEAEWHAMRRKRVWGATIDGDPIVMDEGTIRLVGGSVGSGKTTYVEQQRQPGDLILDIDLLWYALLGGQHQPQPLTILPYVLSARRAVLATLVEKRDVSAWVLTADPDRPRFNQLATALRWHDNFTLAESDRLIPEDRDVSST